MLCEHIQVIKNRYSGREVPCACGVCPTCLQQKASRLATRIENFRSKEFNYYFVTLSYSNKNVPFVILDTDSCSDVLSFRDSSILDYVKHTSSPSVLRSLGTFNDKKLTKFDDSLPYFKKVWKLPNFPVINAVAVHNYDDFRLFLARLRKYLISNNYDSRFKYFASHEYGETTYRPHIHILFRTKVPYETFKQAVMSCWSYCDYRYLKRWFEVAIDPAKYISSYLADSHFLPYFYSSSLFRQRFTHSLYAGFENLAFSLSSVFNNAAKGVVTYHCEYYTKNGFHFNDDLAIPAYVARRWFPKIPNYDRLSYNEFVSLGKSLCRYTNQAYKFFTFRGLDKCFSVKEIDHCPFVARILYTYGFHEDTVNQAYLAFSRMFSYSQILGVSYDYYLFVCYKFYISLYSYYLKKSHENDKTYLDSFSRYLNINYNSSPLLFVDEYGCDRSVDILSFMDSDPLHYIYDKNLQKSFNSKNLKKIKTSTISYYTHG